MADIDLPGLLAFYGITSEGWGKLLEETKIILRSLWTERKKVYKGSDPSTMAGGEKPDADPVLVNDMRRVALTDGYALIGTDAQGLKYVGIYADDDRETTFIAEDDSTPGLPSYWEIVAKLQDPQPFTVGLAIDVGTWTVNDVNAHAEHLKRINSALEDVWKDPREPTTTAELIQIAVDEALDEKRHAGTLDGIYKPLNKRLRHQHDAYTQE